MGHDPKPTQRQARANKAQRAAAREAEAAHSSVLTSDAVSTSVGLRQQHHRQAELDATTGRRLRALVEEHADGLVKICPTDDPLVCYLYWRWTRGPWAGHYVCALVGLHDISWGLQLVTEKVTDVLQGRRKPTKDRYA